MGTSLVAAPQHRAMLEKFKPSLENLLPHGYAVTRLAGGALLSLQRNPALAKCSPASFVIATAQVAQWGLDLGVTAHLVPYGDEVTAIVDYKGYIELMLESRLVASVVANAVHEGDEFEWEFGLDQRLRHVPSAARKDRPVTHAYCIVRLKSGQDIIEVMHAADIDAIRQRHSKQWKTGPLPAWYARKTVIRQAAKVAPKSARLARVIETDDFGPAADVVAALKSADTEAMLAQVTEDGEVIEQDGGAL